MPAEANARPAAETKPTAVNQQATRNTLTTGTETGPAETAASKTGVTEVFLDRGGQEEEGKKGGRNLHITRPTIEASGRRDPVRAATGEAH